ncbi:MAG: DNA-processing protein DprA [bacterium]|nr:DNA-processing protein DprA [bacterium]
MYIYTEYARKSLTGYTAIIPQVVNADISRVPATDESYPRQLRETPGCPSELFVRGSLPPAGTPHIAIVGTRKATHDGLMVAREIARDLARHGIVVVSGLALGIDAAAHEGALQGGGRTVAVLANGLDTVYPPSHEQLARRILERNGCLLSEYPLGTPAFPSQFLARNRIVSGLALATVIIEAPARSGTLVTAKYALEQGREVFVLPGPARHPNFAGSHRLIREGARLIATADDILEDLGLAASEAAEKRSVTQRTLPLLSESQRRIFDHLSHSTTTQRPDDISAATGLAPNVVGAELTMLTLLDLVVESGPGFVVR